MSRKEARRTGTPPLAVVVVAMITLGPPVVPRPVDGEQVTAPKSQVPDRGRPTRPDDEMPLFDFGQYFTGTWTFEWDVPAGVLGPDGTITGRTTYRHVDGPFYAANTEASGPQRAFTIRETIAYHKEAKTATRYITDSRGFSYLQTATIGGDLGGYYNLHFVGAPFVHQGKTVRINNTLYLVSPAQYKHTMTVSTDGGGFTNYGNAWWQKELDRAAGIRFGPAIGPDATRTSVPWQALMHLEVKR